MYGDIIPPKKKYPLSSHPTLGVGHDVEYSYVKPRTYGTYQNQKSSRTKLPIFLIALAVIIIGIGAYHKASARTVFTISPKTTQFQIKEKIPLVLQGREKDSLNYSLVYVPSTNSDGNPFTQDTATSASAQVTSSSTTPAVSTVKKTEAGSLQTATLSATSTGKTKKITLINKTTGTVSLRIFTRFDVDGTTYTLDAPVDVLPSQNASTTVTTKKYTVIGFKGSDTYDTVYGIPVGESVSVPETTQEVVVTSSDTDQASSTLPPKDILSLMPENTLALQKSTIYDKLLDQSAIVVFDTKVLQEFLDAHDTQVQDYFKTLKPFEGAVSYTVAILDYTLATSADTGKPVSIQNITLEITPHIDSASIPQRFAEFKKDTMEKIQKQVAEYITLDTSYTPFWSTSVATEDKIKVEIQ